MNNDLIKKPRFKNRYIIPIFSLAFLIVITMTMSYAYFIVKDSSSKTVNLNATFPSNCTITINSNQVTMSVTKANLLIQPSQTGDVLAASASGSSSIELAGSTICSCTYHVLLTGSSYSPTATGEFTYQLNPTISSNDGNSTSGNFSGDFGGNCITGTISGGNCVVATGTIKVPTSGTQSTHSYSLALSFYNLNSYNQISMSNKSYSYILRFVTDTCNF